MVVIMLIIKVKNMPFENPSKDNVLIRRRKEGDEIKETRIENGKVQTENDAIKKTPEKSNVIDLESKKWGKEMEKEIKSFTEKKEEDDRKVKENLDSFFKRKVG